MTIDKDTIAALVRQLREDDAAMSRTPWSVNDLDQDASTLVRSNAGTPHHMRKPDAAGIARTRNSLATIVDTLEALQREVESLSKRPILTFDHIGGDRLADEVDVLVRRKVIDSRSPAAEALCDYRDPPTSARSDRMVDLERDRDQLRAQVERLTAKESATSRLLETECSLSMNTTSAMLKAQTERDAALQRVAQLEAEIDGLYRKHRITP